MTSVPPPSYQHPGAPPPRPELPDGIERPEPPAGGTYVRLWVPFAVMILAFIGGSIAFAVLAVLTGTESVSSPPEGVTLGATFVQDGLLVAGALLAVRATEGEVRPKWFALVRTPLWRAVGACVVVMLCWWLFSRVVVVLFGEPEKQDIVEELTSERNGLVLAAFGVLVCVLAPLCEELFFRGFMYRVFADRLGVAAAVLLSGAIFGLVHLPGSPLVTGVVLFGLGVGFALLRWWTGSLLPSMALHSINNSISFGVTVTHQWWIVVGVLVASTALVLAIGLLMANSTWGRLNA
jgi:membrane protease YdiL (CAAX protease family)